jgi:hypothetical protein
MQDFGLGGDLMLMLTCIIIIIVVAVIIIVVGKAVIFSHRLPENSTRLVYSTLKHSPGF